MNLGMEILTDKKYSRETSTAELLAVVEFRGKAATGELVCKGKIVHAKDWKKLGNSTRLHGASSGFLNLAVQYKSN